MVSKVVLQNFKMQVESVEPIQMANYLDVGWKHTVGDTCDPSRYYVITILSRQDDTVVYNNTSSERQCDDGCMESIRLADIISLENISQPVYYDVNVVYVNGDVQGAPRVKQVRLIGRPSVPRMVTLQSQEKDLWRLSWMVSILPVRFFAVFSPL
jgi:hypothetical protein